jgi:signal recognition particle subunit SRP9
MKIVDFNSFATSALALCRSHPNRVRFVTKYKTNKEGNSELVLKVTDNDTCLIFKTTSLDDVEKVGRLNKAFLLLMSAPEQEH